MSNRTAGAGSSHRSRPAWIIAVANGTYLRRRPQGWVFRRAIPQDLQARFGQREIVRSLAHVAQSRAAYESRVLGFACEDVFMEARQNSSLNTGQLQKLAAAIVASKREHQSAFRSPLHVRGEDPHEIYEHYRDVATSSAEAAIESRSIFEPDAITRFAAEAGIPDGSAVEIMPTLQAVMTRATAAYCARIAEDIRPDRVRGQGFIARWFSPSDESEDRYRIAIHRMKQLGPLIGSGITPSPSRAPDDLHAPTTALAEVKQSSASDPAASLDSSADQLRPPAPPPPSGHGYRPSPLSPKPVVEVQRKSSTRPMSPASPDGDGLTVNILWRGFVEDSVKILG